MTDVRGRWHLPAGPDDTIFVIKPRNWISPLDENGLPQFFYVHNPDGSPQGLKYPGVQPTPVDPGAINFPLHRHPEILPFSGNSSRRSSIEESSRRSTSWLETSIRADGRK